MKHRARLFHPEVSSTFAVTKSNHLTFLKTLNCPFLSIHFRVQQLLWIYHMNSKDRCCIAQANKTVTVSSPAQNRYFGAMYNSAPLFFLFCRQPKNNKKQNDSDVAASNNQHHQQQSYPSSIHSHKLSNRSIINITHSRLHQQQMANRTVYVSNIPSELPKRVISAFFNTCGQITNFRLAGYV